MRNSSDAEDIYEDIHHLHDFSTPRIITSPISLPTSPTSPLIEFRTSPYYYSELLSKNPGYNIKTSTLAPYKKTSQYRSKPNSQTLNANNFRTYVPKVASQQLNELHKQFAAEGGLNENKSTQLTDCKDLYSVVDKKNNENLQHGSDTNRNPLLDDVLSVSGNTASDLVQTSSDSDLPPAKPPLIRNENFIRVSNQRSFNKNYSYQENSDEETKPLSENSEGQGTAPAVKSSDSIKLFEKPVYQNINHQQVNRPNSLNFKRGIEFETFQSCKTSKLNVCKNKPPLQPKKSQISRSTFGKVRPRSFEYERVAIDVQSTFINNRPKSLEAPKFEVDEFFRNELKNQNVLKSNEIYFLPSPYTENDFSGRIEHLKEEVDMSKSLHLYETAFDSKVSKSDDDLDIDEVTHRSILNLKRPNSTCGFTSSKMSFRKVFVKSKSSDFQKKIKPKYLASAETLTGSLNDVSNKQSPSPKAVYKNITNIPTASVSKIAQSPPATEPLLPKFSINNLSTPKSLNEHKANKLNISFIRKTISNVRGVAKYLSSDSMTSSCSSLDSLNSSSDNNRRKNSNNSQSSEGLSNYNTSARHLGPNTELNILSPISDKSFIDQSSEHDSNKLKNVAIIEEKKPSFDPVSKKSNTRVLKFQKFTNKADKHQGSDSGISMESKTDLCKDFINSLDKMNDGKNRDNEVSLQHRDSLDSIDIPDIPLIVTTLKNRPGTPVVSPPKIFSTCLPLNVSPVDGANSSSHHQTNLDAEAVSHSISTYIKEMDYDASQPETNLPITTRSLDLTNLTSDMPKLQQKMRQEKFKIAMKHFFEEEETLVIKSSVPTFEEYQEGINKALEEINNTERLPFEMPKLKWRRQALEKDAVNNKVDLMCEGAGSSMCKGKYFEK